MAAWLDRRLRPREGWGVFVWLLLAVSFPIAAVASADWVSRDDVLFPLALGALLLGRWTAQRRWRGRTQALLALDAGVIAALWAVAGDVFEIDQLALRWGLWVRLALQGGTSDDAAIFLLYAALLTWAVTFFAGWWLAKGRNALIGFAPLVALTSVSIFYSGDGTLTLVGGLFCLLVLAAMADTWVRQEAWQRRGVDYSPEAGWETAVMAGGIALGLILLCSVAPTISTHWVTQWFEQTAAEPIAEVETEAERLFGSVRVPQRGRDGGVAVSGGTLPRAHLLGGRPDLQWTEVLRVWSDSEAAPYWRGVTYDFYTGSGWQATVATEEALSGSLPLPAGVTQPVVQRVTTVEPAGSLYALAEPVTVTAETVAFWRAPGDLVGLRVASSTYTVTSAVLQPLQRDLRAAGEVYPSEVISLYLQLPPSVPARVRDLAEHVAAGGSTPYERAVRLEQYLRGFPYTLDVERPPTERDVVDYFLFDLGEGYCDYMATAFVVMARSVGIPARLAIGYAGGERDAADGSLVVMEANSHSWPEAYFPGWGWVRFEPTGGRPETESLEGGASDDAVVDDLPARPARRLRVSGWVIGALVLLVGGALVVLGWRWWRGRRPAPQEPREVWQRLVAEGAQLGLPRRPDQTVMEYAEALKEELAARASKAWLARAQWTGRAATVQAALASFAQAYTDHLYGGAPARVVPEWAPIWQVMARFRWVRRWWFPSGLARSSWNRKG